MFKFYVETKKRVKSKEKAVLDGLLEEEVQNRLHAAGWAVRYDPCEPLGAPYFEFSVPTDLRPPTETDMKNKRAVLLRGSGPKERPIVIVTSVFGWGLNELWDPKGNPWFDLPDACRTLLGDRYLTLRAGGVYKAGSGRSGRVRRTLAKHEEPDNNVSPASAVPRS